MNQQEIYALLIEHSTGMNELSLSMAIIEEDRVQTFYYDGERITGECPRIIYEIGSVTKTFTAALLMKLVSEGSIRLSDTIDRFLPEIAWKCDEAVPTILQLVTHTSGIGNDIDCSTEEAGRKLEKKLEGFTGDFEGDCIYGYLDEEDYLETLRTVNWADVSHEFQYSNIGITVLGIIIQRVTGKPYEEVMSRFIHEELGLAHTWLDMPREVPKGYSVALPVGVDQKEKNHWIWNHKIGMAAGGIYSTLEDMTVYVRTYLSNTPKYLEECHGNQLAYSEANHFGIAVTWIKEEDITWHNGATGSFHSFVGFLNNRKAAVVILENHHEANGISVDDIGKRILRDVKG